ncbi:MAG: hypothetical protein VXW32_01575 [Myxococcota bacterium]|nr:hypothetical protein [Myxococcota bacterium]
MRIALASCSNLPGWEVDDAPFHASLEARGAVLSHPSWDDPEVDWEDFDACLIRTTWDYMERREAYVAWAESVARKIPFFNPPKIIRWNTEKTYLKDLQERGIPIAPTLFLAAGSTVDLPESMQAQGWERGFLKPTVGATARETLRFGLNELEQAQRHLDRMLAQEGMMLQPYLSAVEEVGELSALYMGGCFSHAVQKVPQPGDYRVQDDFGARDFPVELTAQQRELSDRAVRAASEFSPSGELLYARVDWLTDDSGQLVLTELELVEPSLFFRHSATAAEQLAEALLQRISNS